MASNRYRHPRPGVIGKLAAWLANSPSIAHVRQALMLRLPFMQLESDVTDVVYLTWMIDVGAARRLVPSGYALWQRDGKTPFTILTYRHGNFGPAFLGPLRRMMPSPLQSNWRLYGAQPNQVFFVKNVMSSFLHALGTRMFSDVLQTHYPSTCGRSSRWRQTATRHARSCPYSKRQDSHSASSSRRFHSAC